MESQRPVQPRRQFLMKMILVALAAPCLEPWINKTLAAQLQNQKIEPSFFGSREDTRVTWLGMAGVLINCRGTVLLIDPLITLVDSNGEPKCEGHYRLRVPLPIESHEVFDRQALAG